MSKGKRPLTEKQLENLKRGRERRAKNLMKRKADEAMAQSSNEEEAMPVLEAEENNQTGTPQRELPKVKKVGGRSWWLVAAAIACFVTVWFIGGAYTKNMSNPFLAFGFVCMGAVGIFLLYLGLRKRDEGIHLIRPGQGKKKNYPANSMNIYYGYDESKKKYYCESIEFEELPQDKIVAKHPQKCLDDGKYYYVHVFDPKEGKLKPFLQTMSDYQSYSPTEFVNAIIMPACQKYARPKATMAEKLRPLILVGMEGLLIFGFLITAPTPVSGG